MIHFPEIKEDKKQQSPIYTRDTIMEMFSISKTTLHRWITLYGLPYLKVNRRVFFKTDDFNEWLEKYKLNKPIQNES
ncbi:uncharacterized protein METZ01_LOCUS470887 [marine metagenome]|uniref:Helix-turn-helix domain-containing protein n=1 Tax=marine metagenome TaxID=408172 RepID=A0A383BDW7_9ZZZZ